MARNFLPRAHVERRSKTDLGLFSGVTPRESKYKVDTLPGQHGAMPRKLSEFGKQFLAKQVAKRMYGVLERPFRNYYRKASRKTGATGELLLRFLECRLDNVVYRMGFARTRKEARQLVSHRSVLINDGKKTTVVDIASYQVKPGDEIIIKEKCRAQGRIQEAMQLASQRATPEWLNVYPTEFRGVVQRFPERSEMPNEINELFIVELYSK